MLRIGKSSKNNLGSINTPWQKTRKLYTPSIKELNSLKNYIMDHLDNHYCYSYETTATR